MRIPLTVLEFTSLCSACIPVFGNTIVLMKDSATERLGTSLPASLPFYLPLSLRVRVCPCIHSFVGTKNRKFTMLVGTNSPSHEFEDIFQTQNVFFVSGLQLG